MLAPEEWWICPDSEYNATDPAPCCLEGKAGTDECYWHTHHARPDRKSTVEKQQRHKFVAWDLEITNEIPQGATDWKTVRPLGISCAASLTSDGELRVWKPAMVVAPEESGGAVYADRMTPREATDMAAYLCQKHHEGYHLVTWNGLGFDLDILAEECQDDAWAQEIARIAMRHIDPAFLQLCQMGYMIKLDKAAHGLGLVGKTEGMSGALAPVMWKQGIEKQEKVLEYVAQDARTTAEVYEALLEKGHVYWTTSRGIQSRYPFKPKTKGDRLLTVEEAIALPLPDTSWMSNPRSRHSCYAWTDDILKVVKTKEDLFVKENEIPF